MESRRKGHGCAWPRQRALSAGLVTALGASGALTPALDARAGDVYVVTSCDDSGAGTLRAAVATAASGDTIDLSGLVCGTITLTSGAIAIPQESLSFNGPGTALAIDGDFNDRVFRHTGTGTVAFSNLTISRGKYVSDTAPAGGCIYSSGNVTLDVADVTGCVLVSQNANVVARGGGIFTEGDLMVLSSRITGNTVYGQGTPISNSHGGAAVVQGAFTAKYSTFSHNQALTIDGHNSASGAVQAYDSVTIMGSTLSNNYAKFFGALTFEGPGSATASITNSTISGNSAGSFSAIYTQIPTDISNSTIAFNRAVYGRGALYTQTSTLNLQSTIIAGNEASGSGLPDDIDGTDATTLVGSNNLITSSSIPLPPGTITDCPRLLPLQDNGGATWTHALRADSPAIDHGNNAANLTDDQRGDPRVNGTAADIGAFEWYGPDEFSFYSGFEPVCDQ